MVTPRGAGRFAFALVRGAGKGAGEVIDQWESLWSPSIGGEDAIGRVCPRGQNGGEAVGLLRPGQPTGRKSLRR